MVIDLIKHLITCTTILLSVSMIVSAIKTAAGKEEED